MEPFTTTPEVRSSYAIHCDAQRWAEVAGIRGPAVHALWEIAFRNATHVRRHVSTASVISASAIPIVISAGLDQACQISSGPGSLSWVPSSAYVVGGSGKDEITVKVSIPRCLADGTLLPLDHFC